jgi:two-component system nitrate/nitrite response regulator NarL
VKKRVQATDGATLLGSHLCAPLLKQECEEGAGQESRTGRSSGRRRSAKATIQRGPAWTVPIGTVLVGTNVLFREGLARILRAADFRIIASTSCIDLSTLPQEQSILLIIDVSDDFDLGLRQIESFKQRYQGGRVAVLADQHQLTEMVSAFRVGANAYLVKVATCETFVKFLQLVMLGVTFLPPEILTFISKRQARGRNGRAADDEHPNNDDEGGDDGEIVGTDVGTNQRVPRAESSYAPRLSARQQSILRCLVQGDSNKTIARRMAMAEATVKVHVKAILRKIRVHNRTQAAIWAMSNGPFMPARDDASPALEELPVEPFPNLNIAQVLSEGRKNGSTSLATLELKGASHIAMPGTLRLVRKNN